MVQKSEVEIKKQLNMNLSSKLHENYFDNFIHALLIPCAVENRVPACIKLSEIVIIQGEAQYRQEFFA